MSDLVELRHDLREQARLFFEGSTAIYTVAGQAIADGIWVEFEQLVRETAQYTGTTAASWNLGMAFGKSYGGVRARELGPDESPLSVGHGAAVSLALNANRGNLEGLGKTILRSGINVWNEAPGSERSEEGPLRGVNESAIGAFSRFQERVRDRVFQPLAGQYTMKQLIEQARKIRKG